VADGVGASFTTDLDSVLGDPEIDLIDICLPTPLHRAIAERALGEKKHVFLEKPIALTLEDADAIVRAAEESDRLLMVGLVLRYFAEYVEIDRRVRSGELGKPLAASAYRLSPPADWADWFADVSQSGGPPIDLMVHDFDQMNLLLGAPRSAFARAISLGDPSYPNQVVALVEHDGGEASVEGSMAMPTSFPFSAGIRVVCERGVIEHGFRALPAEDGGNIGADVQSYLRIHPSAGPMQELTVEGGDPWAAELAEFVSCIEEGRPVERGTARQARAGLAVSLATIRSLASGQPEAVEL
jgi:predicted dehydrogenase